MSLLKDRFHGRDQKAVCSRTANMPGARGGTETVRRGLPLLNEPTLPPGLRVLLVEDEPLIAIDAEDTLRHMGVEDVIWARNVADGLAAIDANTFHAGLLDLRLGGETSIPLAQRLAAQGVPFGFLTGFEDRAIPPEFKDRPIVAKPFTAQQLGGLLVRLVSPQAPGMAP